MPQSLVRAARGSAKRGLALLEKLDRGRTKANSS